MEGSVIRPALRQAAFAAAVAVNLLIASKVPAQEGVPVQVATGAMAEVQRVAGPGEVLDQTLLELSCVNSRLRLYS
jgi:hypothetical protein